MVSENLCFLDTLYPVAFNPNIRIRSIEANDQHLISLIEKIGDLHYVGKGPDFRLRVVPFTSHGGWG